MIEYKEERKRIFHEGVEVASFLACYPMALGLDKINAFLSMLVSNSLVFFLDSLCKKAKDEYDNDTSDKKRFYFKAYRYSLNIDAEEIGKNELCITLDVFFSRGKREEIERYHDSFTFDTEKQIIKVTARKSKKKSGVSK